MNTIHQKMVALFWCRWVSGFMLVAIWDHAIVGAEVLDTSRISKNLPICTATGGCPTFRGVGEGWVFWVLHFFGRQTTNKKRRG
jgi:hypothetical protein